MPKTIAHTDLLAPAVQGLRLADFDPGFTSDLKVSTTLMKSSVKTIS